MLNEMWIALRLHNSRTLRNIGDIISFVRFSFFTHLLWNFWSATANSRGLWLRVCVCAPHKIYRILKKLRQSESERERMLKLYWETGNAIAAMIYTWQLNLLRIFYGFLHHQTITLVVANFCIFPLVFLLLPSKGKKLHFFPLQRLVASFIGHRKTATTITTKRKQESCRKVSVCFFRYTLTGANGKKEGTFSLDFFRFFFVPNILRCQFYHYQV